MIYSFKCKETEKVFNRNVSEKFPVEIQKTALRKLRILNRAEDLLVSPGKRMEDVTQKRHHSMRIDNNWRISFRWENKFASDVEIVKYQ